mgnify:CR=1 FL=1
MAVADLHRHLPAVPPCDLLVVAGDVVGMFDPEPARRAFLRGPVRDWLDAVPAGAVVMVTGNHELVDGAVLDELPWRVLRDETAQVAGLRVHGPAWRSQKLDWEYQDGLGRYPPGGLPPRFAAVPEGVDVLVSHEPPEGLLDAEPGRAGHGSAALRRTVEGAHPRLVVCGHVHGAHGRVRHGATLVVNAAQAGQHDGAPCHRPVVLDLLGVPTP